jgi:hypothetical protein
MPVPRRALGDDFAAQVVERRKERHRPMAVVIVRARADLSGAQRQTRLGALERLAQAFFIAAEDHRLRGRIKVERCCEPGLRCWPGWAGRMPASRTNSKPVASPWSAATRAL